MTTAGARIVPPSAGMDQRPQGGRRVTALRLDFAERFHESAWILMETDMAAVVDPAARFSECRRNIAPIGCR